MDLVTKMDKAPLFKLGQVVITPAANELLLAHKLTPITYLDRHVNGDWGDIEDVDREDNDRALKENGRIHSGYSLPKTRMSMPPKKIWIITEWDRSVTTVLLPEDY